MEGAPDSQNELFQEACVREMKVVNPPSFLIYAKRNSSSMTSTQTRRRSTTIIGYFYSLPPICSRRKVDRKGKLCKST